MSEEQITLTDIGEQGEGHKKTRVGPKSVVIPAEWDVKLLNEIASVSGGKRLPKGHSHSNQRTDYPYIRVVDFENGSVSTDELKYINKDTHKEIQRYTISDADVYISIAGTLGIVGTIPESLSGGNLTENAAKIHDLNGVHRDYLSYYIRSKFGQDEVHRFTVGSTQPKLSLFRLRKLETILPPLPEQRKIATVLYTVDRAIEKTEGIVEQMDIVQQGLLRSSFGKEKHKRNPDIETKTERLGPKQFQVPVTWETTEISSIGEVVTGDTPSTDDESNFGGTLPFVTPKTLSQGKYVTESDRTLSEAGRNEAKPIPEKSVMMDCIGSDMGKVAVSGCEVATNQQINSVVIEDESYLPEFLYYHLQVLSDFIKSQAGQTATPIVNKSSFESFAIFKPPLEEQQEIVDTLSLYDEGKESNTEYLAGLKRLKRGLMQDLLSGTVRTTDTKIEVPDEIAQHG